MFNSILQQHDRISTLENLLSELKTKGTISMESADMIERLVPGELGQIDSDVIFDVDESENGFPVAMEAGLEGLSKVKIAFIIAIIAFIGKYILSLNNNSYNFSASGGGGGGWGGSAPPKFSVTTGPSDPKTQQAIDEYQELILKDIKDLIERYKETLDIFIPSIIDGGIITGMKGNAKVKKLLNITIPRIIKENGGGEKVVKGFHLFADDITIQNNSVNKAHEQWNSFLNVDKDKISDNQIKQLKTVLEIIKNEYTPQIVFSRYSKVEGDSKQQVVSELAIPYFIIDKEIRVAAIEFIDFITQSVNKVNNFQDAIEEFMSILKPGYSEKADLEMGLAYSKPLWEWLTNNLGKDVSSPSPLRNFILEMTKIVSVKDNPGEDPTSTDTAYLNTMTRVKKIKWFVKKALDGGETGDTESKDEVLFTKIGGNKNLGDFLCQTNQSGLTGLLDGALEPLNEMGKQFNDNKADITAMNKACEELEKVLINLIAELRSNQYTKATQNIGKDNNVNLQEPPEQDDTEIAKENLPHMFNLVDGLIQMLLLSFAGGIRFNAELNRLTKNRCDLIISKCQNIAGDLAELIDVMNAIMKEK